MGIIGFMLGLAVGSFVNVLIDRLPRGESVVWGRSHCDSCGIPLRWYELIPVLSYSIQSGKCRHCHTMLSIQYPAVELAWGLLFGYVAIYFSSVTPLFLFSIFLVILSLFVILISDLKYQIIPDSMIAVGIVGIFLTAAGRSIQGVVSGIIGAVVLLLLWVVTKGRGMGLGDVKLMFLLGLILDPLKAIVALYVAFLTGALVGVILIMTKSKTLKSKISFGPFLILGTVISYVHGQQILRIFGLI